MCLRLRQIRNRRQQYADGPCGPSRCPAMRGNQIASEFADGEPTHVILVDVSAGESLDEESDRAAELIDAGSELVGATASGALGLIGGPAGIAAGAAGGVVVTRVLNHIGAEVQQRWLGPRQRVRAGAAFASAIAEIGRRIDAGERLREDGFFDEGRSGHRVPRRSSRAFFATHRRSTRNARCSTSGASTRRSPSAGMSARRPRTTSSAWPTD
jgi:hypothetical protein